MEKKSHTVLVVDDEPQIGKALGRLIKRMGAQFVYADSGIRAIELLEDKGGPYSLILSDQKMPGMDGSVFLEKAKEISPFSVRFLITGYADIHSVVEAVNRGAVHRFITKPWDNAVLVEMIRAGFEYHDQIVGTQELFAVAKRKNKELYTLNMKLKNQASFHKAELLKKDEHAKQLKEKLEKGVSSTTYISEIDYFLKSKHLFEQEKFQNLYPLIIQELHNEFEEFANRNGFSLLGDYCE